MVYLKHILLTFLLVQILICLFVPFSNENEIEIFDITEAIVNSKKWNTNNLIDKKKLVSIDLSFYTIDEQLYKSNDLNYDEKNNVLYHHFNFQHYSSNNLYGINIKHYHPDTLYVSYMIGKYNAGMLVLYKKNGELIELMHNIGYANTGLALLNNLANNKELMYLHAGSQGDELPLVSRSTGKTAKLNTTMIVSSVNARFK